MHELIKKKKKLTTFYISKKQSKLKWHICLISAHKTWYGSEGTRPFWDYIRVACQGVAHNCIESINTIENIRSPHAKVSSVISFSYLINILFKASKLHVYTFYGVSFCNTERRKQWLCWEKWKTGRKLL